MVFMYAMNCFKRLQYVDGSGQKGPKKAKRTFGKMAKNQHPGFQRGPPP